jgi:NAD(P)-dependent dehydrogenase (short-subunit alcohol dehydrogenase family)
MAQVWLVTGSSRGLGRAIVEAGLAAGNKVLATDIPRLCAPANIYGGAKHSFTGEGAVGDRTPEAGLHPQTEERSWQMTVEFLREVFE